MNLEEARNVLWLKSNPRPLSELLDEGYLTQDRLEWAAQWAYNHKLKEAAQVLLDSMKSPVPKLEAKPNPTQESQLTKSLPINITLDKARAMPWPFSPYKGQLMGVLVESRQLTLKDLGYAIENAWDENVKQAAIALSLIRLDQVVSEPPPSAGFVHVISGGRSYAERRESWLTFIEGVVLGWSTVAFIALVWWLLSGSLRPRPNAASITDIVSSPAQLTLVVIVFGIVLFVGWAVASIPDQITKRLEKQIEEHRLGQEGEERVVQLIVQALDGNWHIFRNITIPGRNKGDLDLVLVGPPGIWVLEVKNFRGKYRNIGENWEIQQKKKWRSANKNPSKQAFKNAVRLANFLNADGLKTFVNPVVVWASVTSPLLIENPSVAVWHYSRLPDEIGNIWQGEKLSNVERDKITKKLSRLCDQQRKP
jgi:hypothetical protein